MERNGRKSRHLTSPPFRHCRHPSFAPAGHSSLLSFSHPSSYKIAATRIAPGRSYPAYRHGRLDGASAHSETPCSGASGSASAPDPPKKGPLGPSRDLALNLRSASEVHQPNLRPAAWNSPALHRQIPVRVPRTDGKVVCVDPPFPYAVSRRYPTRHICAPHLRLHPQELPYPYPPSRLPSHPMPSHNAQRVRRVCQPRSRRQSCHSRQRPLSSPTSTPRIRFVETSGHRGARAPLRSLTRHRCRCSLMHGYAKVRQCRRRRHQCCPQCYRRAFVKWLIRMRFRRASSVLQQASARRRPGFRSRRRSLNAAIVSTWQSSSQAKYVGKHRHSFNGFGIIYLCVTSLPSHFTDHLKFCCLTSGWWSTFFHAFRCQLYFFHLSSASSLDLYFICRMPPPFSLVSFLVICTCITIKRRVLQSFVGSGGGRQCFTIFLIKPFAQRRRRSTIRTQGGCCKLPIRYLERPVIPVQ